MLFKDCEWKDGWMDGRTDGQTDDDDADADADEDDDADDRRRVITIPHLEPSAQVS